MTYPKINYEAADRVIGFIENLTLTGGKTDCPFILCGWQKEAIARLFGTLDKKGNRQYRRSLWSLGKKGGKTELAAALVNYFLFGEKHGQEVYSAAATHKQAGRIFEVAAQQILKDEYLSSFAHVKPSTKEIRLPSKFSSYFALSADAVGKNGMNPSFIICDELLADWTNTKGRTLWENLSSSFGARDNPLLLSISTVGCYDPEHFAYKEWEYALRVKDNPDLDPYFLPIIYTTPKEDDWEEEANWHKALPGMKEGCPKIEFIQDQFVKAKQLKSEEVKFRKYFLNQWVTDTGDSFFDMPAWDACPSKIDPKQLEEQPYYAALDMSSSRDITAYVELYKINGVFTSVPYFWIPEEKARATDKNSDDVNYLEWQAKGFIRLCAGKTIDYEQVREDILALTAGKDIRLLGLDDWGSKQLFQQLQQAGLNTVFVRQGSKTMNEPLKYLEKLICDGAFNHGGNPVLRHMAKNMIATPDALLNLRPDKKKSKDKIDGIVALLMALHIWLGENPAASTGLSMI